MGRRWPIAICGILILLSGLKTVPVQADQVPAGQVQAGQVLEGRVLEGRAGPVQDGDTFDLIAMGGGTVRIRLRDIDAPEDDQPFGDRSRRMLEDLLGNGPLLVAVQGEDRFGRALADVRAGPVFVNQRMVQLGGAWAFEDRLSDTDYLLWQNGARRARAGLWRDDPNLAVPPWSWRRGMRPPPYPPAAPRPQSFSASPVPAVAAPLPASAPASAPGAATGVAGFQCGTKTVCRQMLSCEEARYFLTRCGVGSLDGDGDGVPCERGPC